MGGSFCTSIKIADLNLWDKVKDKRIPLFFDLELTARCNNDCRHCYICISPGDTEANRKELSFDEIKHFADEAVSLGALWCSITGGEPLLREDFSDIYLYLKKKGLLVTIFTNATLINDEHIELFKKYPPRDIEVSVYGVTRATYEKVTRRPGSYEAFMRGLNLLLGNGIRVRLKTMAIQSNFHEIGLIASFCRKRTRDYYRFDPFLHARMDHDKIRNASINSERLTPEQIVTLEKEDRERFQALERRCDKLINPEFYRYGCNHLFHCGAGIKSFVIGHDGNFRLCISLMHPDCVFNLREGNLSDAWLNFVPKIREMRSVKKRFLETCRVCPIINLCLWCPAHAYLETGAMDEHVPYFCKVAHARADALSRTQIDIPALKSSNRDSLDL